MKFPSIFLLQTWFSVGVRRRPQGIYDWIFTPFAVVVGAYVIIAATLIIISPWILSVLFFSGIGALGFLTTGASQDSDIEKPSFLDILLSLLCVAVGIYFGIHAESIVNRIVLLDELTQLDIIFGTIVFILTLEITRRTTGLGLTVIVFIFVVYNRPIFIFIIKVFIFPFFFGYWPITCIHYIIIYILIISQSSKCFIFYFIISILNHTYYFHTFIIIICIII